jgi:hypothetical protein
VQTGRDSLGYKVGVISFIVIRLVSGEFLRLKLAQYSDDPKPRSAAGGVAIPGGLAGFGKGIPLRPLPGFSFGERVGVAPLGHIKLWSYPRPMLHGVAPFLSLGSRGDSSRPDERGPLLSEWGRPA